MSDTGRQGALVSHDRHSATEALAEVEVIVVAIDGDDLLHWPHQHLRHALADRAPKTVNNILSVLSMLLKTAVAWDVIDRMPRAGGRGLAEPDALGVGQAWVRRRVAIP